MISAMLKMKKVKKREKIKKNELWAISIVILFFIALVIIFQSSEESIAAGNCNDNIDNDNDGLCDYAGCSDLGVYRGDDGCPINIIS